MSAAPGWASEALAIGDDLARRRCDTLVPTRPQLEFMSCALFAVLWLDGNQLGKTTALLLDLIFRCRGKHPYQQLRHEPPIGCLLLSESHEQLGRVGGIMEKLNALLPLDEIEPIEFRRGKGFAGKPPVINFRNGSAIAFGTFAQPIAVHAGVTLHHVASSEPIPQAVLSELRPRLLRNSGTLRVELTPTPNMPEQTHLRELCEKPDPVSGVPPVKLYNFGLTAENTRPIGAPFPLMSQAAIDEFERFLPAAVRGMRVRGSWDPVITDRHVTAWDATVHASVAGWEDPPDDATLVISGDHGIQAGKQTAVLSAYSGEGGLHPRAWFLGCVRGLGRTSQAEDARAILKLLEPWGWSWQAVDHWVFDRSATDRDQLHQKDNDKLRALLAAEVGVPFERFPRPDRFGVQHGLIVPHKFDGSVYSGIQLLNALCADRLPDGRPCLLVHPVRAGEFARAIETYRGGNRDPAKDMFDGGRYGAEHAIRHHPVLTRFIGRH